MLVRGQIAPGATGFQAGRLGHIEIKDGQILLGKPVIFNRGNIDQFNF